MPSSNQTVFRRYHYDPLDRLASCSSAASDSIQCFYQKSLLATEIQGQIQRSLVLSENQLLAQQTRRADLTECALLGTDQQRSVLNTAEHVPVTYTPYGARHPILDLPGFNGEQPDPVTGHYLLGKGYRAYNPVLMRFNSPESLSPFGEGGINAYAYCAGDPVNRVDPTGHTWQWVKGLLRLFGIYKKSRPLQNLQDIAPDVFAFETRSKVGPTLNINAHGTRDVNFFDRVFVVSGGRNLSAEQLYSKVVAANIDLTKYSRIKLMICHGGSVRFGSKFSNLTGVQVKAFKGEAWSARGPLGRAERIRDQPGISLGKLDRFSPNKGTFIVERFGMSKSIIFNPHNVSARETL